MEEWCSSAAVTVCRNKSSSPGKAHDRIILAVSSMIIAACLLFSVDHGVLHLFGCHIPIQCPLHRIAGIKCALCGISRSLCYTAHGHFQEALQFHHLGPVIFFFLILQMFYRIRLLSTGRRRASEEFRKLQLAAAGSILLAVFVNWIIYLGGLIL